MTSMDTPLAARAVNRRLVAFPAGRPWTVNMATGASLVTPRTRLPEHSPPTSVPRSPVHRLEHTWMRTPVSRASSTARLWRTLAPREASSSISS